MNDPRGSCWRRWDLHVHSPFSELNNGFGTDFNDYAKELLTRAKNNGIACVGITDYFLVDGYKKLRELIDDDAILKSTVEPSCAEYAKQLLILPNIEFRSSTIIRRTDKDGKTHDSRVNFHIVFSDSVSAETIEEDFLRELKFSADGTPGIPDEKWPVTRRNLEDLGKKLRAQHQEFQNHSDIFVGMMNAVVNHNDAVEILEGKPSKFRGRYLLGLACDEDLSAVSWNDQGHQTRKLFYQSSHFLFSSNQKTRKFALGGFHESTEKYLEEFKTKKPCFHGSDAHSVDDLFSPVDKLYNWIKADPTYEGLLKILIEPEDRVFIGNTPKQLEQIDNKPTKFMDSVAISKKANSTLSEHWFNCSIPLNPGLVAIIGNKGSGKSALGETIGVLGKTANAEAFSFLSTGRFRQPKNNKASHFIGELTWKSGIKVTGGLHVNPDLNAYELVKYIPQNYLETLCNELGSVEETGFDQELRSVIFSHVSTENRLGQSSLEDLIRFKTTEANRRIEILKAELKETTGKIVSLERRLAPENKIKLESALAAKQQELKSHEENKPTSVLKPEASVEQKEQAEKLGKQLSEKKEKLNKTDEGLEKVREQLSKVNLLLSTASRLVARLDNFERQADSFKAESTPDIEALGLEQKDILSISISSKPVIAKRSELVSEQSKLEKELKSEEAGSKAAARNEIVEELKAIQGKLDAPSKAYEMYLERMSNWEKDYKKLVGSAETLDSIEYYKSELQKLSTVPAELVAERRNAVSKTKEIFREKARLAETYRELYAPVQEFIDSSSVARDQLQLRFDVQISDVGFEDVFFTQVSQGVRGTYCGAEEGKKRLRKILSDADLDSEAGVIGYVQNIIGSLLLDQRDGKTATNVADIVRKGQSAQSLYDYVYGLDYLLPKYSLGIAGKPLGELSPGERGALLLVFYLLVDQNDCPLVIDQPEENLDNQTVFNLLVPCIKEAKRRRQIIVITHNPNLAVVCDAEQIIACSIDKHDGNRLDYVSGAIENPQINKIIVDILEGTRPAFDNRGAKYIKEVEVIA